MNLTNLFNFKYLMQNIKKSKGLIILLILLVPMFTSIMLLSLDSDFAISFIELSGVNVIFMYIVPIVLSMTLFSYVYKKNSVDFIGSMPLSRKTIFLTNTIGGIAIIAIMQLLTMISTLFLSKIISGVIIFSSMVWDIFIFYTVAYIFVFTVSNLAMSFSGNKFSQLVSICLILFLVPFLIMSGDLFGDEYSYIGVEDVMQTIGSGEGEKIRVEVPYHFTAPSYIFDMICNNTSYEYSTESIVKMTVLSVIYIVIGLIIFSRKKLEMAGEAYENINTHLVIKMLTFVPFMFVYCSLNDGDRQSVFLFFVAILAVYYFLFDLITNKKVKPKISVPAFLISALIVFAIYEGIIPQFGRNNDKIINIDEVQSVCIDSIERRYNESCDFDLLIEDKDLMHFILREADNAGRYYNYIYEEDKIYDASEGVNTIIAEESNEILHMEPESIQIDEEIIELNNNGGYRSANANLMIKLKNGKTYHCTKYLDKKVYESIINNIGTQVVEKSVEGMVPRLEGMHLTSQEKNEILEIINKELSNLTYKDLYEAYYGDSVEYRLCLYEYKNHELKSNTFMSKAFEKLYEKMIKICNEKTIQLLNDSRWYYFYDTIYLANFIEEKNPGVFNANNVEEKTMAEMLYDTINYSTDEIEEFMRKDVNNPVDISKKYIVIKSYYPTYYYTNNLEDIYKIIAKNWNENYDYGFKLNT